VQLKNTKSRGKESNELLLGIGVANRKGTWLGMETSGDPIGKTSKEQKENAKTTLRKL